MKTWDVIRRRVGQGLLAVFAAVSLFGGALHLLPGLAHHGCRDGNSPPANPLAALTRQCSAPACEAGCCECDETEEPEHAPRHSAPLYGDQDCVICQFFAQTKAVTPPAPVDRGVDLVDSCQPADAARLRGDSLRPYDSRGPPPRSV